jgi:hypothetical protein
MRRTGDGRGLPPKNFLRKLAGMATRIKKKLSREVLDKQIRAVQLVCQLKPGEKSVVQELIEERRAEKAKEDRDLFIPCAGASSSTPAASRLPNGWPT